MVRRLTHGLCRMGMSENDPTPNLEQPIPKFRLNAHVFQILGLLAVALALPITMLVLALSDMRGKGQKPTPAESPSEGSAPEVSGLRQSLESIAETNLPTGSLETSMRIFRVRLANGTQRTEKAKEVLDFLKESELGFVDGEDSTRPVWVVTVPSNQVLEFEKKIREIGFSDEKNGEGINFENSDAESSQSVVYRICLEGGM